MGLTLKVLRGKTVGKAVFQYDNGAGMEAAWTLSTSDSGADLITKVDKMLQFLRTYHRVEQATPPPQLATVHQLSVPAERSVARVPENELPAEAISLMQRLAPQGEQGLAADIAKAQELGYEMIPPEEQELR